MVKLQFLFIYYFLILAHDNLLIFCTARPELQPHYPHIKRMRCLTSLNFPQTLVLELKAHTAKEQRQINLILANAKQSTIYRAKLCNEQIELHSMVTLQTRWRQLL